MSQAYAFFDVDGTLIRGKSMFAFHDFWYQRWTAPGSPIALHEHEDILAILSSLEESGVPRELINRRYYEFFVGRSVSSVMRCAQAWAEEIIKQPGFFVESVLTRLEELRQQRVEPVFVSGSFVELLGPIAKHLGVRYVLGTRLMHDGQKYNGRVEQPQTIGMGKRLVVERFLSEVGVSVCDCWAFGDDVSDVPMLETVGHAVAVIGDPALASIAAQRGWLSWKLEPAFVRAFEEEDRTLADSKV